MDDGRINDVAGLNVKVLSSQHAAGFGRVEAINNGVAAKFVRPHAFSYQLVETLLAQQVHNDIGLFISEHKVTLHVAGLGRATAFQVRQLPRD